MAAASAPRNPMVFGLLAVGVLWWLSQRRVMAATAGNGAVAAPATQRYLVPVSGTLPAQGATRATVQQAGIQAGAGVLQSLLNAGASLVRGRDAATGATLTAAASPTLNAYGFDAPQPGQDLVNAYSFGGPSTGVYGSPNAPSPSAPYGTGEVGVVYGPNASYYGVITNPATFTGDPYNDGGGAYDVLIANPAPNWDEAASGGFWG